MTVSVRPVVEKLARKSPHIAIMALATAFCLSLAPLSSAQSATAETPSPEAPTVAKVEPPSWWTKLTPELMVLISGKKLEATKVKCNLDTLTVSRTQSTADGDYLFVWLKVGAETKSGTAVCRITTPTGNTSFELPLMTRTQTIHRFRGLTTGDVMYLIMPDRFANGDPTNDEPREAPGSHDRANQHAYHGGDLKGIRDHLPYLKDLGVTTLWLTPVVKNEATADYHGYGAVDLYAVEPHLGTIRDYQELVSAAHEQGMKIFYDVVPNHVGPKHPWVNNPPLPDWFHGTLQKHIDSYSPVKKDFYAKQQQKSADNDPFEAIADPHATPAMRKNTTDGWFFGILPDMNTENPVVTQYLLQNAIWWAENTGIDGYRVDTFGYVPRAFWSSWNAGLHRIYPNLTTIGEVFHPDPTVTSFFVGGRKQWDGIDSGLSTVFDFPMFFAIRDVLLNGAPVGRLTDILRQDSLYPHPEMLVPFFANHDVTRFAAEKGSSLVKTKLAFGLTLTMRGIPELYYGDEIGMPGGGDPDNRRDFPGGWSDDPKNAFTEAGRTKEQQELFSSIQTLLKLKKEHVALRTGRQLHLFADASAYVFMREDEEERVLVMFNNSKSTKEVKISLKNTPLQGAGVFGQLYGTAKAEFRGEELVIEMPAETISVFSVN
jgi:glycosidase